MDKTLKVVSEEKTKVVSVIIDVYSDGSRHLRVDSGERQVPLVLLREFIRWADGFVSDKIYTGMISASLDKLLQEKIIKSGFRPMQILDKLRGRG